MRIKTREDLLSRMTLIGACTPAYSWVQSFPEGTLAIHIWRKCENTEWFRWYIREVSDKRLVREYKEARARGEILRGAGCDCDMCIQGTAAYAFSLEYFQQFFNKKKRVMV